MKKLFAVFAVAAMLAMPAQAQKQPDPKTVQEIFDCLAVDLPGDWKKAWVVVTELVDQGKERRFEGKFFFATSAADDVGKPLATCSAQQIAKSVYALSADLPAEERRWKEAKLLFTSDGKFNLSYDYSR